MTEACGKAAYPLVPRWGWYFACVLPTGHVGDCQPGGECMVHGPYVGHICPKWPECQRALVARQIKEWESRDATLCVGEMK